MELMCALLILLYRLAYILYALWSYFWGSLLVPRLSDRAKR